MTIACDIELSPVWRRSALAEGSLLTPSIKQVENHDSHGRVGELADVAPEEEWLDGSESLRWGVGCGARAVSQLQIGIAGAEASIRHTATTTAFILSTVVFTYAISRPPHPFPSFSTVQLVGLDPLVVDQRDARGGQ